MVSKARLDLPDPDRPVTTMSLSRGISTDMFLRLCTRAPCTAIVARSAVLPIAVTVLELIWRLLRVNERQFLHHDVASLRKLHGSRDLANKPLVGQVLARSGHTFHIEVPLEMGIDLGG